jgi:hypothetical protein
MALGISSSIGRIFRPASPASLVVGVDGSISIDAEAESTGITLGTGGGVHVSISDTGIAYISNKLGIKTLTPATSIEAVQSGGGQADITATTYGANGGGILHGRFARGTVGSPSAALAGDIIAGIGGRAYHSGGAFQTSSPASIHWVVSENQTGSAFGSYLRILTTPKGSTTRVERVIVSDSGTLWVHDDSTFDPKVAIQTRPVADIILLASGTRLGTPTTGVSVGVFGYCGAAAYTAGFRGGVAEGTPETPTATVNNRILCFMGGHGHDGSAWTAGTKALLAFMSSEDWSATNQGTHITFETTPIASTTRGERMRIDGVGNVGVGVTAPTSILHVKAGTATANTAPLKFTAGTNLTTPEAGAVEWDGTNLYITQTGGTRKTLAYTA